MNIIRNNNNVHTQTCVSYFLWWVWGFAVQTTSQENNNGYNMAINWGMPYLGASTHLKGAQQSCVKNEKLDSICMGRVIGAKIPTRSPISCWSNDLESSSSAVTPVICHPKDSQSINSRLYHSKEDCLFTLRIEPALVRQRPELQSMFLPVFNTSLTAIVYSQGQMLNSNHYCTEMF